MFFNSTKEKFIFYSIPAILFSLIPFFLITGPFLSDLSISLIGLLFLIYCFKKKNFSFFHNKYFYFFLIFCFYLILNSLINNFNLDSLKISFFYFRYGIFVIAISTLLTTNDKFKKYFFYCIFVCFSVLILDGFYEYFIGKNTLGWKFYPNRLGSFFGNELILGSYISRLLPIFFSLYLLIFKKKNKLFFLVVLIFILSEVLTFISGERVAFFYINLSAIFIILFSKKLLKLRFFLLLSSILLIIIISFMNPTAKERIFDQTYNQMNDYNKKYIFSELHNSLYVTAYKMFLDNKTLGVGVKNFRQFCSSEKYYTNKFSCNTHPHNAYIQILAETGIVGFFFLLTVLFYFCKYIFKHLMLKFKGKNYFSDFEICILSGIAIYLWPFVPTGNVFNNWVNITLILNLPFLIWSRNLNKR
jgi:O-antigen ligase